MQPNQAPPAAPPPYQPQPAGNNPYDFITNPAKPKKSLMPGGGSMKNRIMLAAGAAIILLVVVIVFFSILSRSGNGLKEDYVDLAQQQTELLRISALGIKQASQTDSKNLAVTTNLTISSQQSGILSLAKKAGAKVDAKTLALGKNSDTDKILTEAKQTNQFDSVFVKTLNGLLVKYQQTLKKIYNQASKKATKDTLNAAYSNVSKLLAGQSTDGTSPSTPATN